MTIYFYGTKDPHYGEFSNFFPCKFEICAAEVFSDEIKLETTNKAITVSSSEQAIMWLKAILMNDRKTALLLEKAESPKESKRLGRAVTPFDEERLTKWREDIAVYVLTKKFSSSKHLLSVLQSTHGQDIVEASPDDHIWGIGIDVKRAKEGAEWQGENLLGRALMIVREKLNS